MAKRKVSISEIAATIDSEGLGYTIEHIFAPSLIKDEELADLWEKARELLSEVQSYVEENQDSVDDEDEDDEDRDPEEDEDY